MSIKTKLAKRKIKQEKPRLFRHPGDVSFVYDIFPEGKPSKDWLRKHGLLRYKRKAKI